MGTMWLLYQGCAPSEEYRKMLDAPGQEEKKMTEAERKKWIEDWEHTYFMIIGVLMCAVSNPWVSILACVVCPFVRAWLRDRKGAKKKNECSDECGMRGGVRGDGCEQREFGGSASEER